jgi:SAM-dependent methyltransferase
MEQQPAGISKHNEVMPNAHDRRLEIAEHQRTYFNALAEVFDVPQPVEIMDRLRQIVSAAQVRAGEVVLDVGTGAGVLLPLIQRCRPAAVFACDLAERMLAHVRQSQPGAWLFQCDVVWLPLKPASVDVVFMNAMYGNIADKAAACTRIAQALRPGGRLVISHPEGGAFVEHLRTTTDLFIEPFPTRESFQSLVWLLGLEVIQYRDEQHLYLLVARKA